MRCCCSAPAKDLICDIKVSLQNSLLTLCPQSIRAGAFDRALWTVINKVCRGESVLCHEDVEHSFLREDVARQ